MMQIWTGRFPPRLVEVPEQTPKTESTVLEVWNDSLPSRPVNGHIFRPAAAQVFETITIPRPDLSRQVWTGRFPPRLEALPEVMPPLRLTNPPAPVVFNAVPGFAVPGSIWPGQPAIDSGGGTFYLFSGGCGTLIYLQYLDNIAKTTLVAVPNHEYSMREASGVGFVLPIPPALGRWILV
jgi:hypothetical protein